MEVVIYSKPDCHLCDDVKVQLARLRESLEFDLREVNILESAEAFAKYEYEIPVVFINGRKAYKFRLDEEDFVRRARSILHNERKGANGA
jgi:glutaredoxin